MLILSFNVSDLFIEYKTSNKTTDDHGATATILPTYSF